MSIKEGLYGNLTVNGTTIANLSEVEYSHSRIAAEWVPLGSLVTTQVLLGVNKYKLTAKHAYVNNAYQNYISGGSVLAGTFFPLGGTTPTAAGSLVCVSGNISGVKRESADPVMENLEFVFYAVTHA